MLPPTGFWSYTSSDDRFSRGKLSQLRSLLAEELQQQIGRFQTVNIWQDVAAIPPGSNWERQIESAISNTYFQIIIITPALLQSEWCCKEVKMFRERERTIGSDRLMFPIHFIDISHIDATNPNDCFDAEVFRFLQSRQWVDFRNLRLSDYSSVEVGRFLEATAKSIRSGLRYDAARELEILNINKIKETDYNFKLQEQRKIILNFIKNRSMQTIADINTQNGQQVRDVISNEKRSLSGKQSKKHEDKLYTGLFYILSCITPAAMGIIGINLFDNGREYFSYDWLKVIFITFILVILFAFVVARSIGSFILGIIYVLRSVFNIIRDKD